MEMVKDYTPGQENLNKEKRMRLRGVVFWLAVMTLSFMFACAPAEEEKQDKAEKREVKEETAVEEKDYKAAGETVGKEILDTYDAAVAEIAEALADKPEPDVALERVNAIFEAYIPKMEALALKKLALLDDDIQSWGAVNSYLGENRGKRVYNKDQALSEYMNYYSIQKPDEELKNILAAKISSLIDIADAPNPDY